MEFFRDFCSCHSFGPKGFKDFFPNNRHLALNGVRLSLAVSRTRDLNAQITIMPFGRQAELVQAIIQGRAMI
jgi:hypothetical protein